MTRGEMMLVMEEFIDSLWDNRSWDVALLTKDPMETYNEGRERLKTAQAGDKIEELPAAQQSWLRAT